MHRPVLCHAMHIRSTNDDDNDDARTNEQYAQPPLQVIVRAKDGKTVKHDGIKVEFVGSIGVSLPSLSTPVFRRDGC